MIQPAEGVEKQESPGVGAHRPWVFDSREGMITNWLVCGVFPSPVATGSVSITGENVGSGFDMDFLARQGGENLIAPVAGQRTGRADGTETAWVQYVAGKGSIDLGQAFQGQQVKESVGYCHASIDSRWDAKAYLAITSTDSIKVFLNGFPVHMKRQMRSLGRFQDIVPVSLKAGTNSLLCKMDNPGGSWALSVRLLDESLYDALDPCDPQPLLKSFEPDSRGNLSLITDFQDGQAEKQAQEIRVEVVAPCGKVLFSKDVKRGAIVDVPAKKLADGPYEFRLSWPRSDATRAFLYLQWYKGDWLKQVRELAMEAARVKPDTRHPQELRLLLLKEYCEDRLMGDPKAAGQTLATVKDLGLERMFKVHSALMEHREIRGREMSAVAPNGFVRLAWRDDIDGTPQYAKVYLPQDYDPSDCKKHWPMVVNLHGSDFSYPKYIHWGGAMRRHSGMADRHGVIVLEPHGRGMTSYEGIGELDVMTALRLAKESFRVDEDRVYLMGASMGGHGTYNVGTRHPEQFAALGSICGGGGFYHVFLKEDEIAAMSPRERFRAEAGSAWVQAEALLSTPIFITHGDMDTAVTVEYARYIVRLLQRWGYDVRYWEQPGKGHGDLGAEDDMVRWLLKHRLNRSPERVRIRSVCLRSAHAHWVRVVQRDDPYGFILADVKAVGGNSIVVNTENVLEIILTPPEPIVERGKPVKIVWNGRAAGTFKARDGQIVLRAEEYKAGPRVKAPGVEGPVSDLCLTPFAIVVGTASTEARMRLYCQRYGDSLRKGWRNWQRVEPRYLLDTEVTDEIMKSYSLNLVGGPAENLVTRKLIGSIPLELNADGYVIDGQKFACTNAAINVIYPHPLNSGRYVVITAGNSVDGMFMADYLWGSEDFVIEDAHGYVASGRFDCNWRLNKEYVNSGDDKRRAVAPLRKAPKYSRGSEAIEDVLMLDELLESETSGTFKRGVNCSGRAICLGGKEYASGISVALWQSPHTVKFDIGGKWRRLKGRIGIELARPAESLPDNEKQCTQAVFAIFGDGKKLYESDLFQYDSPPAELDVDVTDVKTLELKSSVGAKWLNRISSIDWADFRVER